MPARVATHPDPTPDPADLATLAVRLARGAAHLVTDLDTRVAGVGAAPGGGDDAIGRKSSDTDLVTTVDRASERWLVERLAEARPGDAILGEEGGERAGTTGVRWLLDPIDGTVNFVLGLPSYAVSVAAEVDGRVVAGAVCNPATGEMFRASRGGGAALEVPGPDGGSRSVALHGPREVPLERAVVGTGFGYRSDLRARQGVVAAELLPRVGDIRRVGSAALDLCAVACGRLDGYFEVGLNPWDHGAGALIAAEAGCVLGASAGAGTVDPCDDVPAGSRLVAAAGRSLAPALFALLADLGADRV